MKKILLTILFLFIAFFSTGFAQSTQDTLKPAVPYEIFPMGAMRYAAFGDTLAKMYGMNFHWYGFPDTNTDVSFAAEHRPINPTSVTAITDPFYWDTLSGSIPTTTDLFVLLYLAAHCNDIRVYMPGTSGITNEYDYWWNYKKGSDTLNEWKILTTDAANSGDTVLSDLGGTWNGAQNDPFMGDGYAGPNPTKNHIFNFYYDFIFFFDSTQLASVGSDTDSLYGLEFWVKPAGSATYTKRATSLITRGLYNNTLKVAITQPPGHSFSADTLSIWSGQKRNRYKLLRQVLNLREDYSYKSDSTIIDHPQVDVRLRTFKKIPIFVRGLRIRDWRAQRLLSGKADAALNSAIGQLLGRYCNKIFKSFTIGNENIYKEFHAWAYVNNLLTHHGMPPANILSPEWKQNDLFMRVLRDQSEYSSSIRNGIIWNEQTMFGGIPWFSRYTNETRHNAIIAANEIYYNVARTRALPSVLCTPGVASMDSVELYKHGIRIYGDKGVFTRHMQDTIFGYSSEANGGGSGDYQSLLTNARSAYELDPAHPIPYYLMAQTLVKPTGVPKWSVDSLFMTHRDSTKWYKIDTLHWSNDRATSFADSISRQWADSLYDVKIISPYLAAHPGTNNIEEEALFDLYFEDRSPSPAELYYQMWRGVLTGMKGYALNVGYWDKLEQHGFLRDTTGKILKSDEQKNYQIQFYRLTTPYANRYGYGGVDQNAYMRWVPLLPGFAELNTNIRNVVSQELGPIAATLASLQWKGSVSWHKRDSTPTYMSRMPIKNLQTKALTGALDSANATFVQVSVFKNPVDSVAKFIAIQNRLLWCNAANTDTTDYRNVSFQIDSTKYSDPYSKYALWRITDVSGQLRDTVMTLRDTFIVRLKPGQGKLFRIAPAIGVTTGEMSTNIFNNSRHIAPIEFNKDSVLGYAAAYQKGGKIYVTYPNETPSGLSKRTAGTQSDTLVASDNIYALQTPAIAYDSASGKIGLVYCGIKAGVNNDDTAIVYFKSANYSGSKYNFNVSTLLTVPFQVPKGYTPAPSIMPTNRGDGRNFWVGWTDTTNGGNIAIIGNGGNIVASNTFHVDHPRFAAYVSLASHKSFPNDVQISYQECDAGIPTIGWLSHIFYLSASYNSSTNLVTRIFPLNISAPFGHCLNILPQISVTSLGIVDVTWEIIQGTFAAGDRQSELLAHYIVFRNRNIQGKWGLTLNAFKFDANPLPVLSTDPIVLYPNILHCNTAKYNSSSWNSLYRLMWNNPKTNSAAMAIYGRQDSVSGSGIGLVVQVHGWEQYTMAEPSAEPSLPMLSVGDRIVQPVLYRSPILKDDGNYDARITQYDFPKATLVPAAISIKKLNVVPPPPPGAQWTGNGCKPIPTVAMGPVTITHDTILTPILFMQAANGGNDTTKVDSISFDDNQHSRTQTFTMIAGDTLSYARYFRIGFNRGDTASVQSSLTSIYDYVKLRILARRASNNALAAILDTAILTEFGFWQTADTSKGGAKLYIVPGGFNDSVYISLEASRGDPANGFSVSQIEAYNDTVVIDIPPNSNSVISYKKSDPTQTPSSHQPMMQEQIKVTVVPNPFQASTQISLDVPKDVLLNISLFDLLGRPVLELFNDIAGKEHYDFTLTKDKISQGIYLLRVQSGDKVVTRKIQLLK